MSGRDLAVVLLSGGLDSTTALAIAAQHHTCHALTVSYGQRHRAELDAAQRIAAKYEVEHHQVSVDIGALTWNSALTGPTAVPKDRTEAQISDGVPSTYVPARNTVLLGLALSLAETIGARDIFTGFNVLDASGYPDCRPAFVNAFEALAQVATASAPLRLRIHAPLISMTKAEIITRGVQLGVDYSSTHTCYDPVPRRGSRDLADPIAWFACGRCDACQLRRKGFIEAGVDDPTRYA